MPISKKNKKCCIICDNPKRDLPGVILLSNELRKMKFDVYIVSSYVYFEILIINPDFVFLNHIRPIYHDIAKLLIKKNKIIFILDQEGGFMGHSSSIKYKKYAKEIANLNNFYSYYCCWGERIYREINKNIKTNKIKSKILLTGHPRIDALKLKEKNINTNKVLINTNYSSTNLKFQSLKKEIIDIQKNTNQSLNKILKLQNQRKKDFNQMIDIINFLVNKGYDLIIRPHPFENEKTYINKFQNKVEVSTNNFLKEDFDRSLFCISSYCQTTLDAIIANKNSINLEFINKHPNKSDKYIKKLAYKNIESKVDFLKLFSNKKILLKKMQKTKTNLKYKNLKDLYYNSDCNFFVKIKRSLEKKKDIKNSNIYDFIAIYINLSFKEKLKTLLILIFGLNNYLNITKLLFNKKNYQKRINNHDLDKLLLSYSIKHKYVSSKFYFAKNILQIK